jgi:hypothetical protein
MIITFPGLLFEVDEVFTGFRDHRFPDLLCEAKFLIDFSDHRFPWPEIGRQYGSHRLQRPPLSMVYNRKSMKPTNTTSNVAKPTRSKHGRPTSPELGKTNNYEESASNK